MKIPEELTDKIVESAANIGLDNLIDLSSSLEGLYLNVVVILIMRMSKERENVDAKEMMEACCKSFCSNMVENITMNCLVNGMPYGNKELTINEKLRDSILKEIEDAS